MSDCLECGRDCQGARCELCSVEHNAPDTSDLDDYECPECGGPTSGEGVTCSVCRSEKARADGGEELHGTTEQKDQYSDVVEVTLSEYNSVELDSQLLSVSMLDPQDADFGVTVHRDGPDVALAAGTVREIDREDDRPHFHTYHSLSIEQAREIADGLHAAADEAERVLEEAEEDEKDSDSRGFLRRLMS
ncbi:MULTISPECIES: hypothetical protein [Halobacterium]|uniref:hypothetical protein n=1 Tax=Halobacterium TaxID=2239 RepID=UPI00073F3548|nr:MULTISPECIES: hypothetical protein [Halobacterium]MCG1002848.1 hypothetical protein [Halobacterium noricense]